jgi:hypothetical protein
MERQDNAQVSQQQQQQQKQHGNEADVALRMVLSPGSSPASALLVPLRLRGMEQQQAQECKELEVRMCVLPCLYAQSLSPYARTN